MKFTKRKELRDGFNTILKTNKINLPIFLYGFCQEALERCFKRADRGRVLSDVGSLETQGVLFPKYEDHKGDHYYAFYFVSLPIWNSAKISFGWKNGKIKDIKLEWIKPKQMENIMKSLNIDPPQ